MKVRIVCYEEVNAWILGKFARRLNEELLKLGIESSIDKKSDAKADINHHIIYLNYEVSVGDSRDTLMITHINDIRKLNMIKKQLEIASVGICMSEEVMNCLISAGLPAAKLSFVNPAHDEVMVPRKLVIGITTDVKPDGCKREDLIEELIEHISPNVFSFSIMGVGWDAIVDKFRAYGFAVDHYSNFDYKQYTTLIPTLDYFLYAGQDEGSMAYIDALAAGVKTIVTAQGFHLDATNGITHQFQTGKELIGVFAKIEAERITLIQAVGSWTWRNYAIKHLEIWRHILKIGEPNLSHSSKDGINSLLRKSNLINSDSNRKYVLSLYKGAVRRIYYNTKTTINTNSLTGLLKLLARKVKNRLNGFGNTLFKNEG